MNGHYVTEVTETLTYHSPAGADLYGFLYTQEDGSQYQSGPLFTKDEYDAVVNINKNDVEEVDEQGTETES